MSYTDCGTKVFGSFEHWGNWKFPILLIPVYSNVSQLLFVTIFFLNSIMSNKFYKMRLLNIESNSSIKSSMC